MAHHIIPTRRFDPCYYVPDEISRVRYSLILRIKPRGCRCPTKMEKDPPTRRNITRVQLRETTGTARAAKIIIIYFYVSKYQKKKHVK